MKILIADDQKHTRRGLGALLATAIPGAQITEACDGAQAERLAAETPPALVVMDLRMPGIDGITATQRIKSRQPGVKIIVHSMDMRAAGTAVAAGADAFVRKGGDPEELLRVVRCLLGLAPEPGPAAPRPACPPAPPNVVSGGHGTGTRD